MRWLGAKCTILASDCPLTPLLLWLAEDHSNKFFLI